MDSKLLISQFSKVYIRRYCRLLAHGKEYSYLDLLPAENHSTYNQTHEHQNDWRDLTLLRKLSTSPRGSYGF
ncbi:MAG: hypothetical protein ACFFC6_03505 [Promethearchaeota archaeon]